MENNMKTIKNVMLVMAISLTVITILGLIGTSIDVNLKPHVTDTRYVSMFSNFTVLIVGIIAIISVRKYEILTMINGLVLAGMLVLTLINVAHAAAIAATYVIFISLIGAIAKV